MHYFSFYIFKFNIITNVLCFHVGWFRVSHYVNIANVHRYNMPDDQINILIYRKLILKFHQSQTVTHRNTTQLYSLKYLKDIRL